MTAAFLLETRKWLCIVVYAHLPPRGGLSKEASDRRGAEHNCHGARTHRQSALSVPLNSPFETELEVRNFFSKSPDIIFLKSLHLHPSEGFIHCPVQTAYIPSEAQTACTTVKIHTTR